MARTYASPTRYRKRQVIATASMKPLMCIMIVFTVMFAIFFPTTGDPALVFSSMMGSTYTQGNALSNWQVARETTKSNDTTYFKELPYRVVIPDNEALSNALTIYNFYAYHMDDAVALADSATASSKQINLDFPGIGTVQEISWSPALHNHVEITDNVAKLIAIGVMGRAYTEIGNNPHADHPEAGNNADNMYQEWNSFTHEQKLVALNTPSFMNDPLTNGAWQDGRLNRWDGYNPGSAPGNRVTGKWGYGLIQFTGGRRINMANWAELNGYNFEEFDAQLVYSVIEYVRMTKGLEYVVDELTGLDPANDKDCERAVQLIYGTYVYHGGGVMVDAVNGCSSCGSSQKHTDSNENLYKQGYANTNMSILEVVRKFDAEGPEGFGGSFVVE